MTQHSAQQQHSSLDNLKALLDERADLHAAKKRIEERIKELDQDLRPVLMDRGSIVHNGYKFKVETTKPRVTYDYKAMEKDGINLEAYKKEGSPSTRFTIEKVEEV